MRKGLSAGVAAIIALLLIYTVRVHQESAVDDARVADVIVILGAAKYHGRPSPVLRARLDHGLSLYNRKLAPRILTTGGAGGDPIFTEGTVGRDYLMGRGVPPESIIVEREGSTTAESAIMVGEIMRRMDLGSCIVVTDGYHLYRVKKMLARSGLRVYGSPRPTEAHGELLYWWLCLRQAFGYLLWSVGIAI